jgi:hypothetical protein
MRIDIKGLKEIERKLNNLSNRAQSIDGKDQIPFDELFTNSFISRCSEYSSVEELFSASGFKIDTQEDFEVIPDKEWDEFIRKNTIYANWDEMLQAAGADWVSRKMGFK